MTHVFTSKLLTASISTVTGVCSVVWPMYEYISIYFITILWFFGYDDSPSVGHKEILLKSSTIQTNCLWSCDLQSAVLGSDKRFGQSLSWRPALRTHCLTGRYNSAFCSHHLPAETVHCDITCQLSELWWTGVWRVLLWWHLPLWQHSFLFRRSPRAVCVNQSEIRVTQQEVMSE